MYIPLDNLYEWISGVSRDILIYRFFPHGSRNLEDLAPVNPDFFQLPYIDQKYLIPAICNDQEPLNYNYYNLSWQEMRDLSSLSGTNHTVYPHIKDNQAAWEHIAKQNLASMVIPNINDRVILIHSEKQSIELSQYEHHGFVGAYWWAHGMIARDWYRFAQHDTRLLSPDDYIHDFNIYSRSWTGTREYRLKFLDLVMEQELTDHCRITFIPEDQGTHWQDHVYKNSAFSANQNLSRLPRKGVGSCRSADYDVGHYNNSAIDIVLETLFDDLRWHLTEKVLRPIACGKPFMLAATQGSLEYLRSYGFKTFSGLIDETYDTIEDPLDRLKALTKSMKKISALSADAKRNLWKQMRPICEHNRQLFFSDAFAEKLTQELHNNVRHAEHEIKQHYQTGRTFIQWRKLMDKNTYQRVIQIDSIKRDQIAKLLRQCRQRQRS